MDTDAEGQNDQNPAGLVLYPHFQQAVVPGWLDKHLRWRHRATPALDNMVLLSPHPDWVRSLPYAKLVARPGLWTAHGSGAHRAGRPIAASLAHPAGTKVP